MPGRMPLINDHGTDAAKIYPGESKLEPDGVKRDDLRNVCRRPGRMNCEASSSRLSGGYSSGLSLLASVWRSSVVGSTAQLYLSDTAS